MAKDIPRNTLRQLVRDYKANGLSFPKNNVKTVEPNCLYVKNATSATVPAGRSLKITGFATTLDYTNAYSQMLSGSLILAGTTPASTDIIDLIVTTLEPIPAGLVGKCAGDVVFANVLFSGNYTTYATPDLTTAETGGFRILASSSLNSNNYGICAIRRLSGSGGSSQNTEDITYVSNIQVTTDGDLVIRRATTRVLIP